MLLKPALPLRSLFTPLCVLAAGATWFAGVRVARLRLDLLRQDAGAKAEGDWGPRRSWAGGPDATGDFDPVAADDEFGIYRDNGTRRQRDGDLDYRGPGGYDEQEAGHDRFGEAGYEGLYRDEARYPDEGGYSRDGEYPDEGGYSRDGGYQDEAGYRQDYPQDLGYPQEAGYPSAVGPAAADEEHKPQLFGQIAIYTLLEERVDDFDRLTKQVVRKVRAQEPGTLVFIVHAVPSAPMQRILYEVYRDRAAYEAHKQQPYVTAFEADRRPYVLATNIIELGLQQAKVSPLPSVSDLLSDTGFDLLSDTGFGQPGYRLRPSPSQPGSTALGGGPGFRRRP
jgi:quinol monooxygenase YgiN